jgi:hypothetical protein
MELLTHPWPWYVGGIIAGLTVPALLLLGNTQFGISSSLRHACAACVPANIKFFQYDWKKESWNLFFVAGIAIGAFLATYFLANPNPVEVVPALSQELSQYGISDYSSMVPTDLFTWDSLFSLRGFILIVGGGFLIGFGARYAGGCTSGHVIMGLSNLQWPSLVATCCFMAGGILMANIILPYILNL